MILILFYNAYRSSETSPKADLATHTLSMSEGVLKLIPLDPSLIKSRESTGSSAKQSSAAASVDEEIIGAVAVSQSESAPQTFADLPEFSASAGVNIPAKPMSLEAGPHGSKGQLTMDSADAGVEMRQKRKQKGKKKRDSLNVDVTEVHESKVMTLGTQSAGKGEKSSM